MSFLSKKISEKIISVGPNYKDPRGGIALVVDNYDKYIFESFKYVANSCEGSMLSKIFCLLKSIAIFAFKLMCDREIKIVHIHTASYISFERSSLFLFLGLLFNKTVIMHVHGGAIIDYCNQKTRFVKLVLRKCKKVFVLGNIWKEYFEETIGLNNVEVLENVIPVPCSSVKKCTFGDGKLHFLFLGRIVKEKGVRELINSIADNKAYFFDKIVIHIGGEGEDAQYLRDLINKFDIHDIVKMEGWLVGNSKESLLNNCDVFILPSYFEALPISILEAMSFEMPIIATCVGGIPTIVKHGVNGYLISPKSKESIVSGIKFFIDNKEKIKEFGSVSHDIVERYYPYNVSNHLQKVYTELLNVVKK